MTVLCHEHSKPVEFWDKQLHRPTCSLCHAVGRSVGNPCMPIDDALRDNASNVERRKDHCTRRRSELLEMKQALGELADELYVREDRALAELRDATLKHIRVIETREQELADVIRNTCAAERQMAKKILADVEEHVECIERLRFDASVASPGEVMSSFASADPLLEHTSHYTLPDTHKFTVNSREIVTDCYLGLTRAVDQRQSNVANAFEHGELPVMKIAVPKLPPPPREGKRPEKSIDRKQLRGLFYHLGTCGDKQRFQNPTQLSESPLSIAATHGAVTGEISDLLNDVGSDVTPLPFRTKNVEDGQIVVDLGKNRTFAVEGYLLRHGHEEEHAALVSWVLLGSTDGEDWAVLDVQHNNCGLQRGGPFGHVVVPIAGRGKGFRFIAVQPAGPNTVGGHHIELSGIELYGTLHRY